MADILDQLALASRRAPGSRSFQILRNDDLPRLYAFFRSFDFDQRRAYFGGAISNQSVRDYSREIDWSHTTVIARSGPYCIEAIAMLVSLPPDHGVAELSVGCPLSCNQRPIIAELFNLAIEIGAPVYRALLVRRELANPDLLSLLRESGRARFDDENVQLDLMTAGRAKIAAAC
jgi:hypothetical protein